MRKQIIQVSTNDCQLSQFAERRGKKATQCNVITSTEPSLCEKYCANRSAFAHFDVLRISLEMLIMSHVYLYKLLSWIYFISVYNQGNKHNKECSTLFERR